jgi:hypothetical protein
MCLFIGFEVFAVDIRKSSVLWDLMSCNQENDILPLGGKCRLYLQCRRLSKVEDRSEPGSSDRSRSSSLSLSLFVACTSYIHHIF